MADQQQDGQNPNGQQDGNAPGFDARETPMRAESFRPIAASFYKELNAVMMRFLVDIEPGPDQLTVTEAHGMLGLLADSLGFSLLMNSQRAIIMDDVAQRATDAVMAVLGTVMPGPFPFSPGIPTPPGPGPHHTNGDAWKRTGGSDGKE